MRDDVTLTGNGGDAENLLFIHKTAVDLMMLVGVFFGVLFSLVTSST